MCNFEYSLKRKECDRVLTRNDDIKGVIRVHKSKQDRKHIETDKRTKEQATIYKTLQIE
jgi:hypothetical protein